MTLLRHYLACNSKTAHKHLTANNYTEDGKLKPSDEWITVAYKNKETGVVTYEGKILIIDDFIKEDGIREVHSASGVELTFEQYADEAAKTAVYPGQGSFVGLMYVTGKACGEAGEFSEQVFKALRDDGVAEDITLVDNDRLIVMFGKLTEERRQSLIGELGDELWYWFQKCRELGVKPGSVALANVAKLSRRSRENKIQGSGSDR